jgi:hypothetical protein
VGYAALTANTTAKNNIAIGNWALHGQSFDNSGVAYDTWNVAVGGNALAYSNPVSTFTGIRNTAIGFNSLLFNSTGANNIGIGYNAGSALTTGNNNIDIGNMGVAGESSTIRIGDANQTKTFIAGIEGASGDYSGTICRNDGHHAGIQRFRHGRNRYGIRARRSQTRIPGQYQRHHSSNRHTQG